MQFFCLTIKVGENSLPQGDDQGCLAQYPFSLSSFPRTLFLEFRGLPLLRQNDLLTFFSNTNVGEALT